MSCEKFDRERYEDELARYIRTALGLPDGVLDVYIKHVPVGTCGLGPDPTISLKRDIVGIEVFIEAMPVFFSVRLHDWPLERSIEQDLGPRFVQALGLLLEACLDARGHPHGVERFRQRSRRKRTPEKEAKARAERSRRALNKLGLGLLKGGGAGSAYAEGTYFIVDRAQGFTLFRSAFMEDIEDFLAWLQGMEGQRCVQTTAQPATKMEGSEREEAAERLEPDPQPQEHDHPRERGKSP